MEQFADVYERSNLTRSQLLFWAGQKLRPTTPLYNMIACYVIPARVEPAHMQAAFCTLVASSDQLRTAIEEREGVPFQTVLPEFGCAMEFVDLKAHELRTWIKQRARMVFDLEKRLIDGALLKVADDCFVCYLNNHQIIDDAWAGYLIYRRLTELYELSIKGQLGPRVEFAPFQDYIEFERNNRRSSRHRKAEAYWKQQLEEPADEIKLYGASAGQTTHGHRVASYLSSERVERLRELAQSKEVFVGTLDLSLFILFVSFFFAYLHLVSGARRLSLGIMHHNRVTKSFAETIGMFMEVLPLRVSIGDDETFRSLIGKVTAGVLDSLKHGQFTTGNPIQNSNYQVSFNYINASLPEFQGAPVSAEWIHAGYQNEILDVHVRQWNSAGDLVLEFDFDSDLFVEEEQQQAVRHFLQVVDAGSKDLDCAIDYSLLMSDSEKQRFAELFSEACFAFESEEDS